MFQLCPSVQGWVSSRNAVARSDRQRLEDGAILIDNLHHRSRSKTRAQSRAGGSGTTTFYFGQSGPSSPWDGVGGEKRASVRPWRACRLSTRTRQTQAAGREGHRA